MSIKILRQIIFPNDSIISGVTLKNQHIFPETGLTFTPSPICSKEQVDLHKKLLADEIGVKTEKLKFQHQIHSDIIRVIDETSQETDSDAMITDKNGIILCVKIADCAAILVYDPKEQAIAAIHSGWRGTQQNITAKAINKMSDLYREQSRESSDISLASRFR
jgi:copper oxidase (laccase) domain-containing protein